MNIERDGEHFKVLRNRDDFLGDYYSINLFIYRIVTK